VNAKPGAKIADVHVDAVVPLGMVSGVAAVTKR
jgi:hypothetical protein